MEQIKGAEQGVAKGDSHQIPALKHNTRYMLNRDLGQWVIQTPKRTIMPETGANEVLSLIDGRRSTDSIAEKVADTAGCSLAEAGHRVRTILQLLLLQGIVEFDQWPAPDRRPIRQP